MMEAAIEADREHWQLLDASRHELNLRVSEYHRVLQTDVELSESLTDSHLESESNLTNRKKKRTLITPRKASAMVKCPLHDLGRKRGCIGEGCRVHDLKKQIKEGVCAAPHMLRTRARPKRARHLLFPLA